MTEFEIILRLGAATAGGLLLGVDRELRGIAAGIRTHGMVGLSSAAIMISALLLYETLAMDAGSSIDPLRVVQGLAQAIGFIAAGMIFVSGGNVYNLTSAANLWLAAALGIAAGAGQFVLFATSLALGVILITLVRLVERMIPSNSKSDVDPTAQGDPSPRLDEHATGASDPMPGQRN